MGEISRINEEIGRQFLQSKSPVMVQDAKSQDLNTHTLLQGKPCHDERITVMVTYRLQLLAHRLCVFPADILVGIL